MKAIDAKEKCCKRCNITKSVEHFYKQSQVGKNKQRWFYYDSLCKKCRRLYNNERRLNIKIKAIEYLGGKCVDCGYNERHPEVYDFHHKGDSKEFTIGSKSNISFETMKAELDKCVLLCANCHRIRHTTI